MTNPPGPRGPDSEGEVPVANRSQEARPRGPLVVLTGGGSSGHVTPNLGLVDHFRQAGWRILYIGRRTGIERPIVVGAGLEYHGISAGKFRRYFDWQNLLGPFRAALGVAQSARLLRQLRPSVVFSKGGFVGLPVTLAAWILGIPVIVHESDVTSGLANRIATRFADEVFVSFEETVPLIPAGYRVLVTGSPLRAEIFGGSRERAHRIFSLGPGLPVLLVFGGSQGSTMINRVVRDVLPQLIAGWRVIHICGEGRVDRELLGLESYSQYEYLNEDFPDALAVADLVICRAGANSLHELVALRKPHVAIPLPASASRGDQILNAELFADAGTTEVVQEEALTSEALIRTVEAVHADRLRYIAAMSAHAPVNPSAAIAALIMKRGAGGDPAARANATPG